MNENTWLSTVSLTRNLKAFVSLSSFSFLLFMQHHTSLPFIELFPSSYLRVQWGWKSTTEQSIKEGSWRVLSWWKSKELQPPLQPPWGKDFPALQFEWTQDTDICLWPVLTKSAYILLFSLVASLSTTQKGIRRLIVLRFQEICLMIVIFAWEWFG